MRTETYYIYGISQNGQWLNPRLFVLLEQSDVVFTCVNQKHGSYLYPYYFNGWWLADSWGQGTGDIGKTKSGLNAWITNGSTTGFLKSNGTESTTYYTLSFAAGSGGSVSYAGGEKVSGSSQTVTASPSSGYYFVSWDDGNTSASRAFTWNAANESHGTFTAYFAKYVRVTPVSNNTSYGTVSGGSSDGTKYRQGATGIRLTASPKSGYYLYGWSNGSASATITVSAGTSDTTYTATFRKYVKVSVAKASLTQGYQVDSSCSVSGGSSSAKQGASVSIKASVSSGSLWTFDHWSDGGAATHNVSAGSADTTYTAYFKRVKWTITRAHDAVSGTGVSSVTVAGTSAATRAVADKASFALAVALAEGASARFVGWFVGSATGQAISTSLTSSRQASGDETVFAHFAQTYVEAVAEPANAGVAYAHAEFANTRQYYAAGDTATVRAAATRERWSFLRWEDEAGNVLSTDPAHSFTMGSSSLKRKAIFHMDGINISVSTRLVGGDAQDSGYGSASVSVGDTDYGQSSPVFWGQTANLLATPAEGMYTLPEKRRRRFVIGARAPSSWGADNGWRNSPYWSGNADYYVDAENGNDANSGDETHPVQSVGRAMELVGNQTGKVVEFADGSYVSNSFINIPLGNTLRAKNIGMATLNFNLQDAGIYPSNADSAGWDAATFRGLLVNVCGFSVWSSRASSHECFHHVRFVSCGVFNCWCSVQSNGFLCACEAIDTHFVSCRHGSNETSINNFASYYFRAQNCTFTRCSWAATKPFFIRGNTSVSVPDKFFGLVSCVFNNTVMNGFGSGNANLYGSDTSGHTMFATYNKLQYNAPSPTWYNQNASGYTYDDTAFNLTADGESEMVLEFEETGDENADPDFAHRGAYLDASYHWDRFGRSLEPVDVVRSSWTAPVVFQKWERSGALDQTDNPLEVASVSPDVEDREYVAVFRAKVPVVVGFAVFEADGVTPVQGADLVPGRSADAEPDPDTGDPRWFSGPLPVAPSGIPVGKHIGTWRVDTWDGTGYVEGEAHQEGQSGFDPLSFTAQVEETRIRVVGIVKANTYTVSWQVDAPSGGHGSLAVTVAGVAQEGGTAQVAHGAAVVVTASPADDGSAFRAFLDGGGSPLQHSNGVLSFNATADLSVTAKFGGTASASVAQASTGLGTAGVRVSGSGAAHAASCGFSYGDALEFLATPAENKFFLGWSCTVGGSEVAAAWGAQASYTPVTASVSAVASFGSDVPEFHICLTHAGMANMGTLSIEPAGDGVAVETEDKADFDEATGCTYESGQEPDIDDTFWKVTGIGFVRLSYAPSPLASATFSRWRLYAITDGDKAFPVYETDTRDETVSFSNPAIFTPNRHGVIRAVYAGADGGIVRLLRADSAPNDAGVLSLSPVGTNPFGPSDRGECSASYGSGQTVTASAAPSNGYRFLGWYGGSGDSAELLSAEAAYSFERSSEVGEQALYARFAKDTSALYAFDAGTEPKAMCWRSLRFKNARPFNPSCCRVCADGLAELDVRMASSPEAPEKEWDRRTVEFNAPVYKNRQNARRIVPMRPEKYLELEVRASCRVSMLSVATSMDTLE